jgi:perosamine synthetase
LLPLARPDLSGNELKYLTECIETGFVTHAGRFERDFEKAFSDRFKTPCIATSSGTGALHIALLSLGIGPGDECLVPALTFGATAAVVLAVGARPVIVDVRPDSWALDHTRVLASFNKRTRAIIPVALYGKAPGNFRQFGIPVIEDLCEGIGSVPITGNLAAFSFYGNKGITTGEGGMLCGELGNAAAWRDGGFDSDYRNLIPGLNYRMSNLQAAVGLAQLERFDDLHARRVANAQAYKRILKGDGSWLFVAETDNPRETGMKLKELGIETRPVFTPLHLSPAFRQYAKGKYKEAERIWSTGICLPTGPHLTTKEVERIAEVASECGAKLV